MIALSRIPRSVVTTPAEKLVTIRAESAHRPPRREIPLAEVLIEPIILELLRADGLTVGCLIEVIHGAREALASRREGLH